ncbi:MAG: HEAT repeat domain-containing protein [Planctomycetia bacterium]|nr:HEAT repeat domain-containing protein [Planctomycetia bacterium]
MLALCSLSGCGWLQRPVEIVADRFGPKPEVAQAEMGTTPADAELLGKSEWVLAAPDPRRLQDPTLPRYVNPVLEPIFNQPGPARLNLLPTLEHPEAVVRANSAIGLGRWGDGRALKPLVETVEKIELKLPQREAAAETLGWLTKPSPVPTLRNLLDRFGRCDPSNIANYSPELHAALIRALGRHVDAATDPRFDEAVRAPSLGARQEALAAWSRTSQAELSPGVVDLRADPNPQVRAAAIGMLLAKRHPRALEFARNAIQDFDSDVRLAAVVGLGHHGGPDAVLALERVLLHEGEVLRAEAVFALNDLGAYDKVFGAAGDKAWRVRRSVAHCLTKHPDAQGMALARRYLADDSGEVRKAAVGAMEPWPSTLAGPVLLSAMREPTYETRRLAGEQLARRWPRAQGFTPDLPADRREAFVLELEDAWDVEFGVTNHAALLTASQGPAPSMALALTPQRLDQLQRAVEELNRAAGSASGGSSSRALATLETFGTDLVDALERLLLEREVLIPDAVYRQVLPTKGPAFAAVDALATPEINDRRQAADRLAALAEENPLRPLIVARIAQLGRQEPDGLVSRGLFAAVAADVSGQSSELALAGMSHLSPEVRRMACEHFGKHPDARYAAPLLAALSDPHVGVVLSAVKALGHPGLVVDPAPVERLLTSRDTNLRFESARTLYVNHTTGGAAAFERLAHDADPELRRRSASFMGESGDRVFLPTLISLLEDGSLGVRKTTVDALVALVGTDVTRRPDEPLPALSERAIRWRAWYEQQRAREPGPLEKGGTVIR